MTAGLNTLMLGTAALAGKVIPKGLAAAEDAASKRVAAPTSRSTGVNNAEGIKTADPSAAQRAYLDSMFGRTRDLNLDINIRGNQEIATNFLRSQGVPRFIFLLI